MYGSDSESEDEFENDDESLQKAYEKIYTQWLTVYATNQAMSSEIQNLRNLKVKAKGKVLQLEALLAEKDENLKFVAIKLEKTQKMLRLLNNETSKLDHLITTGKSFGGHSGVGYKGESSSTKIVFVKSGLLTDSIDVSYDKPVVKSIAIDSKSAI